MRVCALARPLFHISVCTRMHPCASYKTKPCAWVRVKLRMHVLSQPIGERNWKGKKHTFYSRNSLAVNRCKSCGHYSHWIYTAKEPHPSKGTKSCKSNFLSLTYPRRDVRTGQYPKRRRTHQRQAIHWQKPFGFHMAR